MASDPTSPAASALPLTVTRNGGIVGYSDRVVVGTDGIASISRRSGAPTRCRLDAGLMTDLRTAADSIDWAAVGSRRPTVRHPDDLVIAVAAKGGLTRLDDPLVQPLVQPVGRLLAIAAAPPQSAGPCKPV